MNCLEVRQRVGLKQFLFKKRYFNLDESTNALDEDTEKILDNIWKNFKIKQLFK